MKRIQPINFVWIPLGPGSGFNIGSTQVIYFLLITLIVWLLLKMILLRKH